MTDTLQDLQEWEELVNEVSMLQLATGNCCLIVEGTNDANFYASFVDEPNCEIVIAYAKEKAVAAIKALNDQGATGVLCIVDRDFEQVQGKGDNAPNLFKTDAHDVETMILLSPALDKVVREVGSRAKIGRNKELGRDVRSDISLAAFPIGVARLYSLEKEVNIKFEDFKYRYINRKLEQDIRAMIKELLNHSQIFNVQADAFIAFFSEKKALGKEWAHICCGHDLSVMLGKALQYLWGTLDSKEATGAEMESKLRLAFEGDHFRSTDLYRDLKQWEETNAPFTCLAI
ncbi:uncharacterized protein DUF4435 [Rhizobium azibense]|nr:uncharacterized protein DUF4435 [Rhizobium azibense]